MFKVAILGASGYTGVELVRLISMHPKFEIHSLSGETKSGLAFGEVYPSLQYLNLPNLNYVSDIHFEDVDIVFCALPHTKSADIINKLPGNIKIIDLSADFRLNTGSIYKKWYGVDHPCPNLMSKFIYGLTEFYRKEIQYSDYVACTGCNSATGLYPILPLVSERIIEFDDIIINLASGVSGAGRRANEAIIHSEVSEGFSPYNIKSHRHLAEFDQELFKFSGEKIRVTFTPHLLPQNRGILATIYVKGDLKKIYDTLYMKYDNEPFINIMPMNSIISTKHVRGSNFCNISVCESSNPDTVIVLSTLDNLIKGSAGQAIQNANLMFNLDETLGLLSPPIYP